MTVSQNDLGMTRKTCKQKLVNWWDRPSFKLYEYTILNNSKHIGSITDMTYIMEKQQQKRDKAKI